MCGDQLGIDAAQSDRLHPVVAQGGQQIHVDLAGIDHLGHIESSVIRDPAAGHHTRLDSQPPAERRRLGAAAVYHDQPDAER